MSDQPKTSDIVQEALDCFETWSAIEDKQRKREIEDLQFQVPELQWPTSVVDTRKAMVDKSTGLSLAARPMLSIPKLDQPIQLVLNQEKAAHLGVQVHPLTEDADDDTAEVLQGLYRAIEVDSRASLARSWAFERAVKAGRGFYRILKEYDETSDHPSDQKIVMKRIYDQGSVYLDPAANEPDGSDAERALIVEDIPWRTYKRLHPKSTLASYTDEQFVALGNDRPGWVTGEGEGRAIRVAEYFYVEYAEEAVTWEGGSRSRQKRIVKWCKLNAVEELDSETWDGRYIPIIKVVGRELIPFDGERRLVGIISQNKDAQRLFNYAASGSVEMAALETKASHAIDVDAIEGYQGWWNQKNIRNFPYLPYKRYTPDGKDRGEPVPIQADMSKMQVNAMLLQQAGDFIHSGTAAFEPSLGEHSPNVRTKGATLALQQQSDQANSHWLDNLAEISMTHEARVVLDLIPYVYDRPGRVARILDGEDNPKQVMFNQPFRLQQKRPVPMALAEMPAGQALPPDVQRFDLTKGRYGVTISIGKAYKSRVEQGQDQLGQLFQAEPALFNLLGDIYLKFADFPGHREAAERMKKMLPPPLQDEDAQNDPRLQLDQAKALIGQLQQKLQELEPERMKAQVQIQTAQMKASADVAMARMNNATKVLVARITAAKEMANAAKEDQEEALALAMTTAADSHNQAMDRQHELNQADLEHQHELEAAQQAHDHAMQQQTAGLAGDAALADQAQGHALAQGDQAHAAALQQAEQQAALTPPAESGE